MPVIEKALKSSTSYKLGLLQALSEDLYKPPDHSLITPQELRQIAKYATILGFMQKTFLTAVTIASLLLPRIAEAASTVSVSDTIAGLGTEVSMSLSGNAEVFLTPPYGPEESFTMNTGSVWIPGDSLEVAGIYSITVEQDDLTIGTTSFEVFADSVDSRQSAIQATETSFATSTTVRVILRDRFGNPLRGRSVELISSRSSDVIESMSRETDSRGEQAFTVTAMTPGEFTVRAIDLLSSKVLTSELQLRAGALGMGGYSYNVAPSYNNYNYGAQKQFYPSGTTSNPFAANLLGQIAGTQRLGGFLMEIRGQEQETTPVLGLNEFTSMTITALDQNGNVFLDYVGTVYLLSTDPSADLPKDGVINFEFRDQGVKQYTLGLSFHTPSPDGMHTLVITDHPSEIRTVLAELDLRLTGGSVVQPNQNITITSPRDTSTVNTASVTVDGVGPPFINVRVTGGKTPVTGDTDRDGAFSIPVTLDETKTEHTLQVVEEGGRSLSQEIVITLDADAPIIKEATFTPPTPKEQTDVLLVVETEEDAEVSFTIGEETYELTMAEPGKYQILFPAPVGGVYKPVITVKDPSGNTTEEETTMAVTLKGLPKVQNVVADPQTNEIALSWDPITSEPIGGYRVYVGTEPGEFLYTLDTDRPTASAIVRGLQPGSTYHFAITAILDQRESEEKSDTVSATVFGVKLEVTPQNNALLLEWNSLQKDSPMSFFLLEYGTEPDSYTEQRTLTGELRAYTLRDLLNGVTYYLKLTPVATSGDRLEELSTTAQGTPTGRIGQFTPGSTDPIPYDIKPHSGAPVTPKPPVNTDTGIPLPAWWIAAGIAGSIFYQYLRRRKQITMTAEFMQSMNSRYYR